MYCHKCSKQILENSKFCKHCGVQLEGVRKDIESKQIEQPSLPHKSEKKKSWGGIIKILVLLAIFGFGTYSAVDKEQIKTNNEAIITFDAGDKKTAIEQFRKAANEATSNEVKVSALKNLAYVYSTDTQTTEALGAFNEALPLTTQNTFDYYLISGEIALLNRDINKALTNYNSAYRLNPENFQINNALALFHLDLEGIAPKYTDYSKALLYAKKANELSPSETSKQNLAIAYYYNKNYSETITLLSSSNFTQHPYAAYWLGLAYLGNKDDANAKIYLQKSIDNGAEASQEVHDYLNSN